MYTEQCLGVNYEIQQFERKYRVSNDVSKFYVPNVKPAHAIASRPIGITDGGCNAEKLGVFVWARVHGDDTDSADELSAPATISNASAGAAFGVESLQTASQC